MSEQLIALKAALTAFVEAEATQSQAHIRPLHQHIVQRLVIEGGFRPDDLSPRPPLRIDSVRRGGRQSHALVYDDAAARPGEQTVLGGLKTKDVDVVAAKPGIGPCLAISVKGSFNAFRNLTNRMEEAAGDCTNLHIAYPALVYGFLHVIRANLSADVSSRNDVAVNNDGTIVDSIQRYHDVMARLTNRSDLRNDVSRYEAVAIALVHPRGTNVAEVVGEFPLQDSPVAFDRFFEKLYAAYDLRFVYSAPALESRTRRLTWAPGSSVLEMARAAGFTARIDEE
ncbi:MAG: hypothetical protein H0T51_09160 [Pirellulales bacterium]|nr:hypothetical protein [Pirellulales bacterium]